jgi:hypothetical protein
LEEKKVASQTLRLLIPFDFQTPTQPLRDGKYRVVHESNKILRLEGSGSTGGFVIAHDSI